MTPRKYTLCNTVVTFRWYSTNKGILTTQIHRGLLSMNNYSIPALAGITALVSAIIMVAAITYGVSDEQQVANDQGIVVSSKAIASGHDIVK